MKTPYGDLEAGTYSFGNVLVTVNELGFTEKTTEPWVETLFAPNDFIKLFTNEELYAIQVANDPVIVIGRTEVQTVITFIDLNDPRTVTYLQALQAVGILSPERIVEILSGTPKRA